MRNESYLVVDIVPYRVEVDKEGHTQHKCVVFSAPYQYLAGRGTILSWLYIGGGWYLEPVARNRDEETLILSQIA